MSKIPVRPSQAKNTSSSSSAAGASEEEAPFPVAFELPARVVEGMRALGFTNPGAQPTEGSSIPDLLVYALLPHSGVRPDHGIVLGVAAELDSMAMFIEGPFSIVLELAARRLRVAIALARRADNAASPEPA